MVVGYGGRAAGWMVVLTPRRGSREGRLHWESDVEFRLNLRGPWDLDNANRPSVCKPCWCQPNEISFLWFLQLVQKKLFYSMEASFEMTFIWWNFYLSYFYYCHLRSGNCLERFEEVSFCCWNVWTPSLLITFCKMQKTQVDLKIKKKKDKQTQLSMQTLFAHLGR